MSLDLAGLHVLLIEDEDDVRHLLCQHLDDLGCRVTDARTGEDGLQRALADPPDVAIVDIMLGGGMNGHAVVEALRADDRTARCRLILSSVLDAQDMASPHTDASLAKPFRRDTLARTLQAAAAGR
ncbi:MAG: hypothetical protein JWO79_3283 [Actinomycetia bacterium]|jgi:CheY-like chemotaxis protein|nr:hypothetical protein [Actinomycetes bacterium]MDQ1651089.1 two-component system, OmpR family, response regulator [Cryptosporangiaceae bacterium]MDQ1656624.1 two-component system, OmpR family, response regulator [Cryptosporangiaceae bacterium]